MTATSLPNPDDVRRALGARVLASGLKIDPQKLDALQAYYLLLARWTRRMNLTSLPLDVPTEPTLDRLFIEPLLEIGRASCRERV